MVRDLRSVEVHVLPLGDREPLGNTGAAYQHGGSRIIQHEGEALRRIGGIHRDVRAARLQDSRSEEHTSELQSRSDLVCRLLLEQKNTRLNSSHDQISYAVFCLKKKATRPSSAVYATGSGASRRPSVR